MLAPDRLAFVHDVIVGRRLREHGTAFREAVADRDLLHVHAIHDFAHGFGRARTAGHNARAQARQIERVEIRMVELGDKHRRHAVHRRSTLLVNGLQNELGVELLHDDHGRTMRQTRHYSEHASKAMEKRHGQRHTVSSAKLLALADEKAVVQDIAMSEHDALRESRSAARILHHDHIVVGELHASPLQRTFGLMLSEQHQLRNAVETAMLFRPHVDEVFEHRIGFAREKTALLLEGFRHKVANDLEVVDIAIRIDYAQSLHVRLFEHVIELVAFVHGIDRDHHHADLGSGVHKRQPVGNVSSPHAQMIAGLHADGEQALCQIAGALVEFPVRPTQIAVGIDDEFVIRIDGNLVAEIVSDGLFRMQRIVDRTRHGLGRRLVFVSFAHTRSLLDETPYSGV